MERTSKWLSIPLTEDYGQEGLHFPRSLSAAPQTSSILFMFTGQCTRLITQGTALFSPQHKYLHAQIVLIDTKLLARKTILSEVQIMHDCNSPCISFHGAFISEPCICICMEFMDKGLFGRVYKQIGPIDIDVGKIALAVLSGGGGGHKGMRSQPTATVLIYLCVGSPIMHVFLLSLLQLRLVGGYPLSLVICSFLSCFYLFHLFHLVMFGNWVISHILYTFG